MLVLLLLLSLAGAPPQRPSDVVKWSAQAPSAPVAAGATVNITVTAQIQSGWKLYGIQQPPDGPKPLLFGVPAGSGFEIQTKRIVAPSSKVQRQDANFAVDTHYYEREASFTIPVAVGKAVAGTGEIPLEVTFQACGAELCLRPFTQKLPVKIAIAK